MTAADDHADLRRAILAQAAAEAAAAKAAHALAEAEERAEDDPDAAVELERCRKFHATVEAAVGFARARRRELEVRLDPAEVMRAHRENRAPAMSMHSI